MAKSSTTFKKGLIPWNKGKKYKVQSQFQTGDNNIMKRLDQRKRASKQSKVNNPMKRPEIVAKVVAKISGINNPMKRSEVKQKVSLSVSKTMKELGIKPPVLIGDNNPRWTGGKKAHNARQHRKRRQLGYIPLNKPFEGSVGHHLNQEVVLNIPEELHKSIPHRLSNWESMNKINERAINFYFEGLIAVTKVIK